MSIAGSDVSHEEPTGSENMVTIVTQDSSNTGVCICTVRCAEYGEEKRRQELMMKQTRKVKGMIDGDVDMSDM